MPLPCDSDTDRPSLTPQNQTPFLNSPPHCRQHGRVLPWVLEDAKLGPLTDGGGKAWGAGPSPPCSLVLSPVPVTPVA